MLIKRFTKGKKGSALLLTLLIVSLLLVIVLSFVVFVRMQLREVSNGHNLRVARQNAKLGMQLAISELQKYAGADQRVTVPATTVFPAKDFDELYDADDDVDSTVVSGSDPGMFAFYRNRAQTSSSRSYVSKIETYTTPAERREWDEDLTKWWNGTDGYGTGEARNPHWVGVFNSALRTDRASDPTDPDTDPSNASAQVYELNPNTLYGEPKRSQLPVWLISGNEVTDFDPLTDTSYPADYVTPAVPLANPDLEDSNTVWMVGTGSAADADNSVDGLDGRVIAPKKEIGNGSYAYWVADESTKANFSVREPDPYTVSSPGSTEYRNRLQVPQRVGWERMKGFANVFDTTSGMDVNDPKFERVMNSEQVTLIDEGFADAVKNNFHHITSYSKSLFTDTALGGLKKDFTRFLEEGAGLDPDDPIPDPARYSLSDARFKAWGGTNSGFPHTGDAEVHGIPTWGQLRDWYQNEASVSDGSVDPDVNSGMTPVLSYLHFNGAFSYDGSSSPKMLKLHWAPLIALWNPYDVKLKSDTYNIKVGSSNAIRMFIVEEDLSLGELQAKHPDADWQEITAPGGSVEVIGPGGKPVLEAYEDSSDPGKLKVRNFTTASARNIVIFKADLINSTIEIPADTHEDDDNDPLTPPENDDGDSVTPDLPVEDRDDRYFVKLEGNPDSTNMDEGPWPYDTDLAMGTSDAFGRFFYGSKAADPANYHEVSGTKGRLVMNTANVMEGTRLTSLPIDRKFNMNVTTDFEPGEVKMFTLQAVTEWTSNLTLVNDYDPDMPTFCWINLMEVNQGPDSAEAQDLKFLAYLNTYYSRSTPTVELSLDGETFFKSENFGSLNANYLDRFMMGRNWEDIDKNADQDVDGTSDTEEEMPKFVHLWRPLYDTDGEFENKIFTLSGSETEAANWSFGESSMTPFSREEYTVGSDSNFNLQYFTSAFSRFNLGAKNYEGHPLIEKLNDRWEVNSNKHPGNVRGSSRLPKIFYQKGRDQEGFKGVTEVKWERNQVDQCAGGPRGFVLANFTDNSDQSIKGLSQVAIRNAKRAESEILSLGQFQQVNLSPYYWQPSFPVGNSDASPYVDREAIAGIHSRNVGRSEYGFRANVLTGVRPNHARPVSGKDPFPSGKVFVDSAQPSSTEEGVMIVGGDRLVMPGNTMIDLSYLLNENIWDRYFLSTLTYSPTDYTDPLPNARIRYRENVSSASSVLDFDLAAAYLENMGALNVNSTSVEAWKALLTSFRNLELGESGEENPENTVPVTRTLDPIEGSLAFHFDTAELGARDDDDIGNVSLQKDYSKVLSGFRYLDDEMIQVLAERIVDEVRLRGPFYSLSDFINRRLAPPSGSGQEGTPWYIARTDATNSAGGIYMDEAYDPFPGLQGINGALQRAINLSGINGGVNHPGLGDAGDGSGDDWDMVYTVRIRNRSNGFTSAGIGGSSNSSKGSADSNEGFRHTQEPAIKSNLDTEHLAGAPVGEAGQLLQGAPGFVTQGDLLAMIAPALTARGDTFMIRAYGEFSGAGDADARAWLEAVVQRVPDPIKPAGNTGEDAWRPTNSFGRRFKIVSMRWLTPEEI
ncbi:hypothetical protein P0Y35_05425 [Kiritimatiellaeota bacterium B1221]|nr:hypothetical protein [Kiritimatiellaeota bacterium B1221]